MRIDGDAARAARREAAGEPVTYTLGGIDFEFPVELPWDAVEVTERAISEQWSDGRFIPAYLETLLGVDQFKRLREDVSPSFSDLKDMYETVTTKGYGAEPGESSSSLDSSAPSGDASKPKSKGSTGKTRRR